MEHFQDSSQRQIEDLRQTAESMRKFRDEATPPEPITEQDLAAAIDAEISQGRVIVDKDGFTSNSRDMIIGRVREYLQGAMNYRHAFFDRFQHFEEIVKDLENIPKQIEDAEDLRDQKIKDERFAFESDPVIQEYRQLEGRYKREYEIHAHLPNLKSKSIWFPFDVHPMYLTLMVILGIAEWFINYDTLFLFFGIPVIAIGATFVLALCLSLIAHQHGVDLKQWKKKFGPATETKDRPYGILILATLGLAALILVTGWMRYQAVMGVLQTQTTANILGTQYSVRIDPQREVIISLGANVLAWLVGVFISYFAHDQDPVYVQVAIDFRKAEKRFNRRRNEFEQRASQIRHQFDEQLEQFKNRQSKLDTDPYLREALKLKAQIEQHELAFRDRARTFLITQYGRYRSELLKKLKGDEISITKLQGDKIAPMSKSDFQTLSYSVPDEILGMNGTEQREAM